MLYQKDDKLLELLVIIRAVPNGKSETHRDAETGILKFETETENFSDLIEKHICDRQMQHLRLRDPLLRCARFRDLGRICRDFSFFIGPFTTPHKVLHCLEFDCISVLCNPLWE